MRLSASAWTEVRIVSEIFVMIGGEAEELRVSVGLHATGDLVLMPFDMQYIGIQL